MKATIQKLFKNEIFLSLLLLFLTTLVTYANSITKLGYYHDDWYLLWSGQARGAASIIPLFQSDRPFMGVVYSLVYRLLGDVIINWQLYALFWRFVGAAAFFWILRLIWPNNKYITTMMAVLFVIYPGFLSIPNANTKQNHLYGFGTALLSIAFMLQALKTTKKKWKFALYFASFILAVNYLFIYEYMIGLEGMRLLLLGYTLFQQKYKSVRSLTSEILKKWWPFPIAMASFVYWRIFIFDSSRNATDASRLVGDYLGDLRNMSFRLIFETGKDFLDTSIFAWFYKPYTLFSNAEYSNLGYAFLMAGIVIGLVYLYTIMLKRSTQPDDDNESNTPKLISTFIILGAIILVCAIFPVVLSGRDVDLSDAYKSYGLHPIAGVVMLVGGLVLMLQPNFRKLFLIALIGLSVSTQQLNTDDWQRLWDYQRETWWQLTWRAPDIKNDTLVMVYFPDGYRLQQDYEIWGPVNLIYRPAPAKAPAIQAEVLTSDTAFDISKNIVRDNFDRDIKLHRDFNNLLLISLPSSVSCIHVVEGIMPVYSENDAYMIRQVGAYSKLEQIITTGTAPTPPNQIFGSEPGHNWCYYYQKASLARQAGDWKEIGKLFDQAQTLKLEAGDKSEIIPFFEGLVNLGRYDEAKLLYNKEIKGRAKMRAPLCESMKNNPTYSAGPGYDYATIYKMLCQS
jgi:hypothetical protein